MSTTNFRYERGDVIRDHQTGRIYRIERRIRDHDTDARLYIVRDENFDRELIRNAKLIENPHCFAPSKPTPNL